jgi:ABC-type phosphate transport system permease subunit
VLQVFWHVTLPNIRWGLLYGVILTNARAMGEFGAVSVISGRQGFEPSLLHQSCAPMSLVWLLKERSGVGLTQFSSRSSDYLQPQYGLICTLDHCLHPGVPSS